MASNILSKFLSPTAGEPSIYETLQQHDDELGQSEFGGNSGMALDEENLDTHFPDYELDEVRGEAVSSRSAASRTRDSSRQNQGRLPADVPGQPRHNIDELDDEVPQSLLIEDEHDTSRVPIAHQTYVLPPPVPGPASHGTQAKWHTTQEQQRLHHDIPTRVVQDRIKHRHGHTIGMIDPKEKAMWMWANVENLDNFLQDVYDYFVGNGIWCIFLSRLLNLLCDNYL